MRAWQCLHSSTSACVACALSIHDEEFGRDGIGANPIAHLTMSLKCSVYGEGRGIMITTITAEITAPSAGVRGINRQAINII